MTGDSVHTDEPSDGVLVARAQAGDSSAFGVLVRRYADRVYGLAVGVTGDAREAEDATQEAFVRAWRGIGRFEGRSQFFTWLFRIAINEAKRHAQRAGRRRESSIDDHQELEMEDDTASPQASAESGELRGVLQGAIGKLEPDYRLPLILRDVEGLDTKQASEMMGLKEAAFKSRLHRARMALREEMEPYLAESSQGDGGSNE